MTLAEIYAQIPDVKCRGKCQGACGPIGMAKAEATAIRGVVGEKLQTIPDGDSEFLCGKKLTCPLLANGRCGVYAHRPVVCRLWGAVKAMRCPFGCRPKRWVKPEEASRLLRAAAAAKE